MTRGASLVAKATAIDELHALLKADLACETPLRSQSITPVHWTVALLASTVTPNRVDVPFQPAAARRVGPRAVEHFRAEVERFTEADNRAGGGRDREALISHLIANVRRLARADYDEQVGTSLFSAIAEALLILTWMTFDVAPESALAQRYSTHARQMAHRADDRLLEVAALAAMSRQAHCVGIAPVATELAAAVRKRALDGDPSCLRCFDAAAPTPWKSMLKTVCDYPSRRGLTSPSQGPRPA